MQLTWIGFAPLAGPEWESGVVHDCSSSKHACFPRARALRDEVTSALFARAEAGVIPAATPGVVFRSRSVCALWVF